MLHWKKLDSPNPFNDFKPLKVAEVTCFHCHKRTTINLQTAEDLETKYWRLRCEALIGQLNTALKNCQILHGNDPMRIYFEKELKKIRENLG